MAKLHGEPPIDSLRRIFNQGVDYPLVLRELIQNADDCRSTWLAIGFSDGIPGAKHRFLGGPALFAVNDGPLLPGDIRAICSLGQGTKVADASSVGKFGLGLKSVFKFAELLFFADFRLNPGNPYDFGEAGSSTGQERHFDVLSPWLDEAGRRSREREDWEPFEPADRELLGQQLRSMGIEDGFAVWVPLRQRSYALSTYVMGSFDEDEENQVSKKQLGHELLRVFPLLQNLTSISYCEPGQPLVTLTRHGGSRRRLSKEMSPFTAELRGALENSGTVYPYALYEVLDRQEEFAALQNGSGWPTFIRYEQEGEYAGREEKVPDPAIPHAGVVWQQLPGSEDGKNSLEAGWAVFLPMSDRKSAELDLPFNYRLTLHGYFFPSDDRRTVYSDETPNASEENRTKTHWNRLLKKQLIEPLILEGLPDVAAHLSPHEVSRLSQALREVLPKLGINARSPSLTERWQWLNVWREQEATWQLVATDSPVLPLEAGFWPQSWQVATRAAGGTPLYDPAAPHFLRKESRWTLEQTGHFLLSLDWPELLRKQEYCLWLQRMLPHFTTPLGELDNELIVQLRPTVARLTKLSREAGELLHALLPEKTASLPKLHSEETASLLAAPLSVLLLPYGHSGTARLNHRDCEYLLTRSTSLATLTVIKELEDDPEFLLDRPVIPVGDDLLTPRDVTRLAEQRKVFSDRGKEGTLLEALNGVLPEPLKFVPSEYESLFGQHLPELPRLDIKTARDAIEKAESLSPSPQDRLKLFKQFIGRVAVTRDSAPTLRYLLHGEHHRREDLQPLIYGQNNVWGKAARLAARHSEDLGWTFIDATFSHLSEDQKKTLNLSEATAENVAALLKSTGQLFPVTLLKRTEIDQLISGLPWDVAATVPLLETEDGQWVTSGPDVFRSGSILLKGELRKQVHILRMSEDKAAAKVLTDKVKAFNSKDAWFYAAKLEQPWQEWPTLLQALPVQDNELPWIPLRDGNGGISLQQLVFLLEDGELQGESLLDNLTEGTEFHSFTEVDTKFREATLNTGNKASKPPTQSMFRLDEQVKDITHLVGRSFTFASGLPGSQAPESLKLYLEAFGTAPRGTAPLCELLSLSSLKGHQAKIFGAAQSTLGGEILVRQLRYLSARLTENPASSAARRVYLMLLTELRKPMRQELWQKLLPELSFPNADGQIKKAEDLSPYEKDVDAAQVLDKEFSDVLFPPKSLLTGQDLEEGAAADEPVRGEGYRALLNHVRHSWEDSRVDRALLGLFLLLTDNSKELREAARNYLGGTDPDVLRNTALAGCHHRQELDEMRANIQLSEGQSKPALNLLGEEVLLRLQGEIRSLFTNPQAPIRKMRYPVQLRIIDTARRSSEELNGILQQTIRDLYDYYGVKLPNLDEAFKEARNSDEIALRVTQRLLLRAAPSTWQRQLGVLGPELPLSQLLTRMNQADRKIEHARQNNEKTTMEAAQAEFDGLMDDIHDLLTGSPENCEPLLAGVRGRIEQMQYLPESVPFELLQNADDALIEWAAMGGDLAGRTTCEVRFDGSAFSLRHRGRPINRMSSGEEAATQGYAGDLEKMLTLVASDKAAGPGLTGKFGLGFKSIYLLGDQPTVLSHRTHFTILGGVYPRQLSTTEKTALQELYGLRDGDDDTLIHLPVNDPGTAQAVIDQFERSAPLLLAFTRKIDELVIQGRTYKRHLSSLGRPGIELLEVTRTGQSSLQFLQLQAGSLVLLIQVGPIGFVPLDDRIPRLWCLAPLREPSRIPMAVGADFPIDPGRARIATEKLDAQMPQWQRELGDVLNHLLAALPEVSRRLAWKGQEASLTSFWELLAAPTDERDVGSVLLWSERGAYRQWASRNAVVPSGLDGAYATLVDIGEVRILPDALSDLLEQAAFLKAFPPGKLISEARGAEVAMLLGISPSTLSAGDILEVLIPGRRVSSQASKWLRHPALREASWWLQANFLNQNGEWCSATQLASPEDAWFTVLPADKRFAADYPPEALEALQRQQPLELVAEQQVKYLLEAPQERQTAALKLLQNVLHHDSLARQLSASSQRTWLADGTLQKSDSWKAMSSEEQRHIANILQFRQPDKQEEPAERKAPPPPDAIERIAAWWEREQEQELKDYDHFLYGSAKPDLTEFDPESPRNRADWFTLLMIGSFQRMGRQTQDQHNSFLELCRTQGWLDVFASEDRSAGDWHGILNGFLTRDPQYIKHYYWMDGYLPYYQFSHWLDDYAQILLDLPASPIEEQSRGLKYLLAADIRESYQGSGLSAPPLHQALGQGSHLVLREILRQHPQGPGARGLHRHTFMPTKRLRRLLSLVGADLGEVNDSTDIHRWLVEKLGLEQATFRGAFDIPLDILARDEEKVRSVLGKTL